MDQEDEDFLRKLIAETEAMQPSVQEAPGIGQALAPLVGYEAKSGGHLAQDMRRKYFLDQLNKRYGANPSYLPAELSGPLVDYRQGKLGDLGSQYRNEGMFTGRNPLAKGFQWFASPGAVALNASQWVGDKIAPGMYPEAGKNLAKSLNTATVYGAEDFGLVPKGTGTVYDDYAEEREQRGEVPWTALDAGDVYDVLGHMRQSRIDRSTPASRQHLEKMGVNPTVASLWGGVMDTMLDPFNRTGTVLRAARAGVPGAAKELAKDYMVGVGVPAGTEAVGAAPAVYDNIDKLLNRLHGVE